MPKTSFLFPSNTNSHEITKEEEVIFLMKTKKILESEGGKYDEFLEIVKDFKARRIGLGDFADTLSNIFSNHKQLLDGLYRLLPEEYEMAIPLKPAVAYVNKVQKRFKNDESVYISFLCIMEGYQKGHKSVDHVYEEIKLLFREHPDLEIEFTRFMGDYFGIEKRENLCFRERAKNPHEEITIQCEDDQYEMDMLIHSLESAFQHGKELFECQDRKVISIDEYLSAQNFKCIEQLYGEYGLEVVELLRKNPIKQIKRILLRLKNKIEEMKGVRIEANKVWAKVYAVNHEKARQLR